MRRVNGAAQYRPVKRYYYWGNVFDISADHRHKDDGSAFI